MTLVAVVLAAGFGTRLHPLTRHTPKPLLDVGGRPVLDHLVDRLVEVDGLVELVVVVNGRFAEHFHEWAARRRSPVPVTVVDNGVLEAERRAGAVADLARAMAAVDRPVDHWLVVGGDNLLDDDLAARARSVAETSVPVVLCRDLGDAVPPARHGEVTVDGSGRIVGFREKPDEPRSPLVATCTYVLDRAAPDEIGAYLADGGDPDAPGGFVGWLAARRPVRAEVLTGTYFDIGDLDDLAAARAHHAERGDSPASRAVRGVCPPVSPRWVPGGGGHWVAMAWWASASGS